MKGSVKLARISGIDLFLHWTFLILLAWIVAVQIQAGSTWVQVATVITFILTLFACVTLHELGHAFAARRYGIKTKNILLLPIGGIASLENFPEKPGQELAIAVAGPLVNILIAGLLAAVLLLLGKPVVSPELTSLFSLSYFLQSLLYVNIALFVFNLIPAFPLDGGRVFRALLAIRLDRVRATKVAARTGQVIAAIFILTGLFSNLFLAFIGFFIFLAAQAETSLAETQSILKAVQVRDVLMRNYTTLRTRDTLRRASEELLNGQAASFLVMENGRVAGTLSRESLIRGLTEKGTDAPIGEFMDKDTWTLQPDMLLEDVYKKMQAKKATILPVYDQQQLIGTVDMDNILEYIMIRNASRGHK